MASLILNPQQTVENQILYNRALIQIGLASFRLGKIKESSELLLDICQNAKHKELIGQKMTKNDEKTPEQEAEEKKRQIPFHFQINLPQLECVHLTCSMLIEVPNIAANMYTLNKSTRYRSFRQLVEKYDSNAFQGVADSHRDHVVFAARALS